MGSGMTLCARSRGAIRHRYSLSAIRYPLSAIRYPLVTSSINSPLVTSRSSLSSQILLPQNPQMMRSVASSDINNCAYRYRK